MPPLRELQLRFMEALSAPSSEAIKDVVPNESAALRLRIYENNIRANFTDALHSSFPAIWRLVGEPYFRQTGREFQRHHPSRAGDLLHAGKAFPSYLAQLHCGDEFGYLGDVARLEWLIQETLLAAEHPPFELQSLARIAPADYDALCFVTHPALRLFESPYPALRIWEANTADDAEPPRIDLAGGGDRVAVMRCRLQLQFHRLSTGEYSFLESLRCGECFAAAVTRAIDSDTAFEASAALQRFVAAQAVVDFKLRVP